MVLALRLMIEGLVQTSWEEEWVWVLLSSTLPDGRPPGTILLEYKARSTALWPHSCLRPLPETYRVTNSLGPRASHKSGFGSERAQYLSAREGSSNTWLLNLLSRSRTPPPHPVPMW